MAQTSLHSYFASKSESAKTSVPAGKEQGKEAQNSSQASVDHGSDTAVTSVRVRRPLGESCVDANDASLREGRDGEGSIGLKTARISILQMEQGHINAVKQLTSTTIPMRYSDKFFKEPILDAEVGSLTRVALFEGQPVAWIRCRFESGADASTSVHQVHSKIYIQVLCVLAPYRRYGIATGLLDSILTSPLVQHRRPGLIYAHVWEQNEDAMLWYERRGFRRIVLLDQYYRRLRPTGAWIVRRDLDQP